MVYMVEMARFKNTKAAHLSLSLPLSFAVEKNKLWTKDLDRNEYEAQILKQAEKNGSKNGDMVAIAAAKPPAPAAPSETVAVASVQAPAPKNPSPVVSQPEAQPKLPAKPESTPAARSPIKDRACQSGHL